MKVIIPVAGMGVRLKPHTYSVPKVLIQVAGKPILSHILDELVKLKVKKLILIVGYMGEKIKEYVEKNYKFSTIYVYQEKREGLGHAIYLSSPYFENEPVLIILGDTIFKCDLKKVIEGKYSAIGVKEVENPERFGTVQLKNKFITNLVEKSKNPPSNLAIVGIYYIKNSQILKNSLEELIKNGIKTAGEYQLTDALQIMVKKGEKISYFKVEGWYDCGKPETLLETNKSLLELNNFRFKVPDSVIINPVFIGKDVVIKNSIIGPYVSIAEKSEIVNSILKNSIIGENTKVENVLLDKSIIGSNAHITGKFDKINLGDSSEIYFSYKEG
jgi:glucose-1-phosphate thymidylyltransferase